MKIKTGFCLYKTIIKPTFAKGWDNNVCCSWTMPHRHFFLHMHCPTRLDRVLYSTIFNGISLSTFMSLPSPTNWGNVTINTIASILNEFNSNKPYASASFHFNAEF